MYSRLPVIIRSVISGLLVAIAGTLPWAWFVSLNIKYYPGIPWALVPTIPYLWIFWKYTGGAWWPKSTSEKRNKKRRAYALSGDVWGAAIIAGIIGLISILLFQNVLNRMIRLPAKNMDELSQVPKLTLFFWLIMSAAVAGITEETAFRGYIQQPIEERHGPLIAILITGILFGFMHFTHPEVTMILLPFYMAIAAVYGTIAYLTNSIMPGLFLHAGGNILGGLALLTTGQSEWQASVKPSPLIWETGTDASFWFVLTGFLVFTAGTIGAFMNLRKVTRET